MPSAISFSHIPNGIRVPLFYAELNNSKANTGQQSIQRTLIVGQKVAAGVALPNVPILSQGVSDAVAQGGAGSMLALMVDKYRQNDSFGEVWLLPLVDDGGATAANGAVLFTAQATANGTLYFYVGDVLVTVAVTSGMTLANLATALVAAVNANTNLPVTAAVDGVTPAKVNFTAKNGGLAENDIALLFNAAGTAGGQTLPTGLAATITAMAGGATNPSLTAGFAALGDMAFDFIVLPYADATSLDALKTLLDDNTGRWSWNRRLYGHGFAAFNGTLSAATTLGLTRNDPHVSILAENGSPTPFWLWAPAYAGAAAVSLKADPGRPLQTLTVNGVLPPPIANRYIQTERNTLLFSGIATFVTGSDGTVALENVITTYQKNAFAQPDNSYLEIETLFQLMFLLRDLEIYVTSNYARMKLTNSLARVAPGSFTVTAAMVKNDLIGHYAELVADSNAQDLEGFAASVLVEVNTRDHNRLDVLYTPTIMNQLRVFAALAQFRQ